ncbi:MAG: OmpA family protein [Granulosicoccus sp.]|nr:OmpA family protein [Granulosicoccus sp.]
MTRLEHPSCPDNRRPGNGYRLLATLFMLFTLPACFVLGPSIPGQVDTDERYQRRVYAGIAGASTRLQPVTDGSAYEVENPSSAGAVVTLGLDVAKRLALELTAADLGAVSLSPIATAGPGVAAQQLTYSTVAGSLLYYVTGDRARAGQRKGLAGYTRIGVSQTGSSADIRIDEEEAMQLFVGLGAEYMMNRSTGLRAEFVGYDGDASAAQLGVVYRFGRPKTRLPGPLVEQTIEKSVDPQSQSSETQVAESQSSETQLEPEQTAQASTDKTATDSMVAQAPEPNSADIAEADLPALDLAGKAEGDTDDAAIPRPAEESVADARPAITLIEPTANVDAVIKTPKSEQTAMAGDDEALIAGSTKEMAEQASAAVNTPAKVPANENTPEQLAVVTPKVENLPAIKVVPPVRTTPNVESKPAESVVKTISEPPTPVPTPVIAKPALEGVLRGVDFVAGSSALTPTAKKVLVRYAALLKQSPGTRIEIRTHTDNTVDAATAMKLTRLRAVSIARVLIGAGVQKQQLAARAFGSNVPRADNQSAGGRKLNNRVEIKTL